MMSNTGDEQVRERILSATTVSAEDSGVRGFSLEQVASNAGVSRTTVYRYFPGGRTQLLEEAVTWEIGRFWRRLASAVEDEATMEDRLVAGLVVGRKLIVRSRILSNLMDPDLEELLAAAKPSEPLVNGVVRDYMRETLEAEAAAGNLREGLDLDSAADYLMRMTVSWLGSPTGVDLTDPAATRRVVRQQFLAGVVRS